MDTSDNNDLRERIANLEDEQIMRMFAEDIDQYRPETLAIAEEEARRRGLDPEKGIKAGKKKKTVSIGDALVSAVGAAKAAMDPGKYSAAGKAVICDHCGAEVFTEKRVLLNTRTMTFFKFDWLDSGAAALICDKCSRIHWFAKCPDRR